MIRNIKLKLTERQKLGLLIIGLAVILSVSILPVLKRKKPAGPGRKPQASRSRTRRPSPPSRRR